MIAAAYVGGRNKWPGMKAIPVSVRERILQLHEQGKATAEIPVGFGYCVAAVRRVRRHFKGLRNHGDPHPLLRPQDASAGNAPGAHDEAAVAASGCPLAGPGRGRGCSICRPTFRTSTRPEI